MYHALPWVPLLSVLLLLQACAPESPTAADPAVAAAAVSSPDSSAARTGAAYAFNQPDAAMPLPDDLEEISGLTALPDGRLAAVQDEKGHIYILDPAEGTILDEVDFGGKGDYEGIEFAGERIYVLESNGTLFEVTGWQEGDVKTDRHKTDLKGKNDAEGLGYEPGSDRLLIALKEDPGPGVNNDKKAVYAFDLQRAKLSDAPLFTIDAEAVEKALGGKDSFKPSALAVRPGSGEIYVLSSVLKALVVFDASGALLETHDLRPAEMEQPEALAFMPDGTLYVAGEGVRGPGMLYRFDPR